MEKQEKNYKDAVQREFTVDGCEQTFRIRKMNGIELMAVLSQYSIKEKIAALKWYNTVLSCIEVKCGESWLQVYDGTDYYPAGVEDDFEVVNGLINYAIAEYLYPAFVKSGE